MPVSKQAKKRMRNDAKKKIQNTAVLTKLKNLKKKFMRETDLAKATELALEIVKGFDKAVSSGIIPRKRADRAKSRTAKILNKIKK
jgi:small subunit ribosomal protein S20